MPQRLNDALVKQHLDNISLWVIDSLDEAAGSSDSQPQAATVMSARAGTPTSLQGTLR